MLLGKKNKYIKETLSESSLQPISRGMLTILLTSALLSLHVLSPQNASAWRCFTFSKNPVAVTAEESLQAGHMTQLSSPSVMNHVMHASYGEVRPANCTAASQ